MPERGIQQRGAASYSMVFFFFKFRNMSTNILDEYEDDVPISSSKRGGGGGAFGGGGNNGAFGGGGSNAAFGNATAAAGLYPCSICNRHFASDRIEQHEEACRKASKARRVFDSTKQRLQGTEAAAFYRKSKGGKTSSQAIKPTVYISRFLLHINEKYCFFYFIKSRSQIGDKNMKISFVLFVMLSKLPTMRNQVVHKNENKRKKYISCGNI